MVHIGVIHAAQYAAKGFVTESFTCTSGTSERRPLQGWAILVGAAGAIPASSRGLALDLAPLRVNCVSPGLVDTEMYLVRPCSGSLQSLNLTMMVEHTGRKAQANYGSARESAASEARC
jgi:NAD(P)-dependent dehydrogenase (short-subunit alcohol dehydrogenase family)